MFKYNVYTTVLNYLPLALALAVVYAAGVSGREWWKRAPTAVAGILYFFVQWRWVIYDYEGSAILEVLWASAEAGLMVSILLLLKGEKA